MGRRVKVRQKIKDERGGIRRRERSVEERMRGEKGYRRGLENQINDLLW